MLAQLLVKGLAEALTQSRIWSVFFGSPLDTVLKVVFRVLNSVQRIIISVLRSGVTRNCPQGLPSMMVVLETAVLNRKARTERNMGNGKGVEGKTDNKNAVWKMSASMRS